MGVEVPDLDDRTYEDLLEDARKRIPVYEEDWTDHNAHDPGITVLELLTWLSESYRYQLDRIEDRHRRKYVQLLDERRGPEAATATVRVEPSADVAGETVDGGTRLVADDGDTERLFETTREATLTDASVAKVVSETPAGRTDHTPAAASDGTYFHPFGERAAAGSTLYLGFDTDPFEDSRTPLTLRVEFFDDGLPEPAEHGTESPDFDPTVELTWEYCTDYRAWEWSAAWEPFAVSETTRSLYESGFVTLSHPGLDRWKGVDRTAPGVLDLGPGYAWIRVRLTSPGYEVPPQIDRIRTNVLPVEHRAKKTDGRLTRSDGAETTSARPHQRFEFDESPITEATVIVGDEEWTPVVDFGAAGTETRAYVVDEMEGTITFGDNVRGDVPPPDQTVEATEYTVGGGPGGNVPASSEWWFARPDLTDERAGAAGTAREDGEPDWAAEPVVRDTPVHGLEAASGGRAAESVEVALDRVQRDLQVPYRAVTADDCEYIALHTPGLRFGRAKAVVTDSDSPGNCVDHDAIRVVVVPFSPEAIARPTPSKGFLEAVQCHLESHRLLTDRVTATAPTYVGIGVTTVVELAPGVVAATRQEAIETRLEAFLSPLRGFGGDGWPFGRPVYDSELYEVIGDVNGVDCVVDVDVTGSGDATVTDEGVEIPDTALVASMDHTVVVRGTGRDCGGVHR